MYKSITNKTWRLKDVSNADITRYMNAFGLSEIEARLIAMRGIKFDEIPDFLEPKLRNLLPDPFHLLDMDKAVNRIIEAIKSDQKICIFGDYDVDGATSSALLKKILHDIGIEADIYIPDRMKEGYGPSPLAMYKLHEKGIKLVITVDCGAMAYDAVNKANEIGLDVIIIDHHICADILPKALAVINPNRLDERSEYKYLAAVGVSFLFAVGFVKQLKAIKYFEEKSIEEPKLLDYLDIVALGTVCDVMPLIGLNRAFVKQGLKTLAMRKNIGLRALADRAAIDTKPSCYHLGFILGPRINAGGRVGESYIGSRLLSSNCEIESLELAGKLEEFNEQRKYIELQIVQDAINMASIQADHNFIMVSGHWHPGVIGVVAGKLKENYQKPVAVVSVIDGIAKASCRSVPGVDFGSALAQAKLMGLVEVGGGHAMAAGFTTTEDKLERLKEFLNQEFTKHQHHIEANSIKEYDLEITSSGMSIELHDQINNLGPFGNGNNEPLVKVDNLYVLKAHIVGQKHISCILAIDRNGYKSKSLYAIAFNAVGTPIEQILLSTSPLNISAIGHLKIYHRNGEMHPQLVISDLIVRMEA
ncbi:MAG UNVERIFIED_CONTAM: single-stranded-DNA-specific exonuclease RecJ [Rickettsiaceae bacterium]|jgi:single-stranded-DNA-specific exonuclease